MERRQGDGVSKTFNRIICHFSNALWRLHPPEAHKTDVRFISRLSYPFFRFIFFSRHFLANFQIVRKYHRQRKIIFLPQKIFDPSLNMQREEGGSSRRRTIFFLNESSTPNNISLYPCTPPRHILRNLFGSRLPNMFILFHRKWSPMIVMYRITCGWLLPKKKKNTK